MYTVIKKIDKMVHFDEAQAHCDVPCGIYDPITAQIAALTVVRMADLIAAHVDSDVPKDAEYHNRLIRLVMTKEEHAEKAKHEIRVIWGDFIKPEHAEKYPQLKGLVHSIMKAGSESRQHAGREAGVTLVERVNEFAEIFWSIKGIKTKRAKAPYAPSLVMVYPEL